MGVVVKFPKRKKAGTAQPSAKPLPPDVDGILKDALGKLRSVALIGIHHDGSGFVAVDINEGDEGLDMIAAIIYDLAKIIDLPETGPPGSVA